MILLVWRSEGECDLLKTVIVGLMSGVLTTLYIFLHVLKCKQPIFNFLDYHSLHIVQNL